MKSPLFEDIDYIHTDPIAETDVICECYWANAFGANLTIYQEFPLRMRRERYHGISEILHRHNGFFALYIVRGGRGTRMVNGTSHSVARGDIFLMAPGLIHCYRGATDLTVDAIYFQESLWSSREWEILSGLPDLATFFDGSLSSHAARGFTDHFGHLSPEPHARVETTLAEMRRELKTRQTADHLAARARFFALLVQIAGWRNAQFFTTRPARGAGIAEVLSFCDENFHRAISNEQLAGMMHFSQAYFREVFTREVGMPPASYLRHVRLQHAQKLIAGKKYSIADVARLSGFGGSTQLGRAFKKTYGTSPLDFQKSQKTGLE